MQSARLNGIVTHYRDEGAGRPVVLANSLGTDFRVWDRMAALLPPGLRLIRYDKRGHGLSEAPDAPYAMEDLVADAAALMDHLGVRDALFIGLSIGGMIAQGLAATRPDLVRAMVLMDTAARIGEREVWNERIAAVEAGGIGVLSEAILGRWFSQAFRERQVEDLAIWRHMLTRTPVQGYLGCCVALREADLSASTAGLTLPTLAIVGEEDGSTPPDLVRATAALIPGARFEKIAGVGHLPCVEAPEATAALIAAFMAERHPG